MYDEDDPYLEMPSSERIPMVLMEPYIGKEHTLYTDNFYRSPSLGKHFLQNNTHLCGTIRNNRKKFSTEIVDENLEKGDAVFYKCKEEKMIGCKYRAKKDKASGKQKVVYLLSTCHQPLMQEVDAYSRDNTPVFKPAAIKCYNQHMGGVDWVDQQLNCLQTLRKTYKWYRKLAIRLICESALNAHKVYQVHTGKKDTFTEFLHNLIVLLTSATAPRIQQQIIEDDTHARLT